MLVTFGGHQNVQHTAVLVRRSPQVIDVAVNLQADFIKMPLVSWLRASAAQLIGVDLSKLATPLPHGLVRDIDATSGEEFLNIAVAEGETEVKPDSVGKHLGGEEAAFVGGERDSSHASVIRACHNSATRSST